MTNPFARPEPPDSDETIPLVPDSGYADHLSPWSSGYESTAVEPLAGDSTPSPGGYSNPVLPAPGGYTNPAPPSPQAQPAPSPYPLPPTAPAPFPQPPTAPSPYGVAPVETAYEQPPVAYGAGPYEPARDSSGAPMAPYSYVYSPQQIEHPNAVPTLVLGVLGFVFGVTFPIAWYLGAKGTAEVKRNPQRYRSGGMMTVGMVLGIIGTAFMILGVLGMVALIMVAIAAGA